MSVITISTEEIVHQLKCSYQLNGVIEGIVHRRIIEQTAAEIGLEVIPEELQQAANNFRLIHQLWRADDTWSWLHDRHLSLDEFEESIYISALSSKLAQHLFMNKIEPFFVEHQLDYMQVVLYEILLDDEDLAMELFYAMQEGEMSFYETAHEYIQEPELRRSGGYRGVLRRSDLKPEISAAVFAATPPQILKPIITSKGVHLILVEELLEPQFDQRLQQKILSTLFADWLKKQAERIEIMTELPSSSKARESTYSALSS